MQNTDNGTIKTSASAANLAIRSEQFSAEAAPTITGSGTSRQKNIVANGDMSGLFRYKLQLRKQRSVAGNAKAEGSIATTHTAIWSECEAGLRRNRCCRIGGQA